MAEVFAGKKILLGVTGGIAAYKVLDWLRNLKREGAEVTVVMTEAAARFVAPLSFAALSGRRVYQDMFSLETAADIPHIALARDHDLILVAPATAQTISRLANGMADDLLSTVILATSARVLLCPSMNSQMYMHPAVQGNMDRLRGFGYLLIEPEAGLLACGEVGPGRLPEWDTVREAMLQEFALQDLAGRRVLITAGPTREDLDPVRFLSNRSSGKMGYALARAARRRGAEVILVAGPTTLPDPPGVTVERVVSAEQMRNAVFRMLEGVSVVVKAAAVSDYRPAKTAEQKIKKGGDPSFSLLLNDDILKELGMKKGRNPTPVLVGFAAESQDLLSEGRRKLEEKNCDLMVVNDISSNDAGFGVDTNRVMLLDRFGAEEHLPLLAKEEVADRILDRVIELLS